jgi:PAS domain S-box-containing protein
MKKKTTVSTGVTELRLQAEQQLLNISAFLQGVQDSLSAHIAILDKNGCIVHVNAAWRTFGESNGLQCNTHCLGVNYLELCDSASGGNSEEASLTSQAIRDVLAGVQQEARIEYPCNGPDEKRWFLLKVTKFEAEGDVWVVLAHENITERKQILESLSVSEARYRLLANNVPDIVYSLDGEGKIVTVNSQAFERYGYTEQNSRGKPFLTFIHPEDREIVINSFVKAVQEQRKLTHGLQFRIVAENGAIYWFELNSRASFDHDGRYLGEDGVLRDITERKQAEQALRESEEKYRLAELDLRDAQAVAHVGNWKWDLKKSEISWSDEMYSIFGIEKNSFTGRLGDVIQKAIHPDDLYKVLPSNAATIANEPIEYRIILPDSSIRHIWAKSGVTIFDQDDKPAFLTGIAQDITERKQTEAALYESRAILQAALDQSSAGIAIANAPDGKLRYVNDAGLLIRGETREKVVNGIGVEQYVASWQILDLDGRPLNADEVPLARAVLYGETCAREFIIRRDCTDDRVVSANAAPILDDSGQVVAGIVVFADTTERKQAEDVLRESQERFKAIANFGVSWESWFGPDGKYLWVNPGVEYFTGYLAQEILAMPDFISTVIADEDRSMFINRFQEAIRGNRGENFEFRYLHKNGVKRWLSVSWQPIYDAQGNPLGTRSSGFDITERKAAEEALLKKMDELERFQRITIGRELKMIELKKEVNHLLQQAGQPEKYRIVDEK